MERNVCFPTLRNRNYLMLETRRCGHGLEAWRDGRSSGVCPRKEVDLMHIAVRLQLQALPVVA